MYLLQIIGKAILYMYILLYVIFRKDELLCSISGIFCSSAIPVGATAKLPQHTRQTKSLPQEVCTGVTNTGSVLVIA